MEHESNSLNLEPAPGSLRCVWERGADGRPSVRWEPVPEPAEILVPDFVPAFLLAG